MQSFVSSSCDFEIEHHRDTNAGPGPANCRPKIELSKLISRGALRLLLSYVEDQIRCYDLHFRGHLEARIRLASKTAIAVLPIPASFTTVHCRLSRTFFLAPSSSGMA